MKCKHMLRILALVVVLSMIFTTAAFATPKYGFGKTGYGFGTLGSGNGNGFGNGYGKWGYSFGTSGFSYATPGYLGFGYYKPMYKPYEIDYESALEYLINKQIVKGYGNGDYGLSGNVKRGDVIVMIARMLDNYDIVDMDDDDVEELNDNLKVFEDVEPQQYYYRSIKMAKKLGIAKGDGSYFNPEKPVTIQEVIWLVERAGNLLKLDFNSDKIDTLEEIYEDDLNTYAKRQDVFWILFYMVDELDSETEENDEDEDEDVEFNHIKLDMEDDSQLDFKDSWFVRAYNAAVDDEDEDSLEYVKFNLPKNGKLYYEYDEDESKNTLVTEKNKYYLGDDEDNIIENITFVPDSSFSGTVTIEYTAYTEEESYPGLIKIAVERNDVLDDLNYEADENEYVNFEEDDFENIIDGVKFALPDTKTGTLYLDKDKDGKAESDETAAKNTVYDRDELDDVIFVPYQNFSGKAVINYTGIEYLDDEDDVTYSGKINITVKAVQEIPTLKLDADFDEDEIEVDFVEKLEDLINDDIADFDDLDYVKFKLPEEGTLRIKLESNDAASKVKESSSYQLDEIEYISYTFEDDGTVDLTYTVYDNSGKAYNGVIRINIE